MHYEAGRCAAAALARRAATVAARGGCNDECACVARWVWRACAGRAGTRACAMCVARWAWAGRGCVGRVAVMGRGGGWRWWGVVGLGGGGGRGELWRRGEGWRGGGGGRWRGGALRMAGCVYGADGNMRRVLGEFYGSASHAANGWECVI